MIHRRNHALLFSVFSILLLRAEMCGSPNETDDKCGPNVTLNPGGVYYEPVACSTTFHSVDQLHTDEELPWFYEMSLVPVPQGFTPPKSGDPVGDLVWKHTAHPYAPITTFSYFFSVSKITPPVWKDGRASVATVSASEHSNLRVKADVRGRVTSEPEVLDCSGESDPQICFVSFSRQSNTTLTAEPKAGWKVDGWVGGCTGQVDGNKITIPPGQLSMTQDTECSPNYVVDDSVNSVVLELDPASITQTARYIDPETGLDIQKTCTTGCTITVPAGASIILEASGDASRQFAEWALDCSGFGGPAGTLVMDSDKRCYAMSEEIPQGNHQLTITTSGGGAIKTTPAGINCGQNATDCVAQFSAAQPVTISAIFEGLDGKTLTWEGDCAPLYNGGDIVMTMNGDKSCHAIFHEISCSDTVRAGFVITDMQGTVQPTNKDGVYILKGGGINYKFDGTSSTPSEVLDFSWDVDLSRRKAEEDKHSVAVFRTSFESSPTDALLTVSHKTCSQEVTTATVQYCVSRGSDCNP